MTYNEKLKQDRANKKARGIKRKEYELTEEESKLVKQFIAEMRAGKSQSASIQNILQRKYTNLRTGQSKKIFKIERSYKNVEGGAIVEFEDTLRVSAANFEENWEVAS